MPWVPSPFCRRYIMHVVGSSAALSSGDHPVVTQCLFVSTLTRKTVKHALAAAKLREDGDCRFSQGQKGRRAARENVEAGIRGSDGVSSV